jgi:RNA polymerase sigma-70 factor (ECF subfamily)
VDALRDTLAVPGADVDRSPSRDAKLRTLLKRVADGESRALEEIWALCADDLYALALWRTTSEADAEDALQDVFVRLAKAPRSLRGVRRPRSYLLRMVQNAAANVLSAKKERQTDDGTAHLVVIDRDLAPGIDGETATRRLRELSVEQREVVYLRYFADLKLREIAEVCGVSVFTVASRHRLAIQRLRTSLGVSK